MKNCKYKDILLGSETDEQKKKIIENEIDKKVEMAKLSSQQSLIGLQKERIGLKTALETSFKQDDLNFSSIRSLMKSIDIIEHEIEVQKKIDKEYFGQE